MRLANRYMFHNSALVVCLEYGRDLKTGASKFVGLEADRHRYLHRSAIRSYKYAPVIPHQIKEDECRRD